MLLKSRGVTHSPFGKKCLTDSGVFILKVIEKVIQSAQVKKMDAIC